jgi:hypothetical protein
MSISNGNVEALTAACDAAYAAHKKSCSHAVWAVIKAVHDPNQKYLQANSLIDWMTVHWSEVNLEDGYLAANMGAVVVGGKKDTPNGHVICIYPGDKIPRGGYQYFSKAENKNVTMARKGLYPRAMSTALGSWPGAMSCGEKTVYDPWGNEKSFKLVQFWTARWPLTS